MHPEIIWSWVGGDLSYFPFEKILRFDFLLNFWFMLIRKVGRQNLTSCFGDGNISLVSSQETPKSSWFLKFANAMWMKTHTFLSRLSILIWLKHLLISEIFSSPREVFHIEFLDLSPPSFHVFCLLLEPHL